MKELAEYVEREAWRRARAILEKNGIARPDLKLEDGAAAGI